MVRRRSSGRPSSRPRRKTVRVRSHKRRTKTGIVRVHPHRRSRPR